MTATKDRRGRDTLYVRNPLLRLPSFAKLQGLPTEQREVLAAIMQELALDARGHANRSWRQHKAPMACYWKAVSVYAGHTSRAIKPRRIDPGAESKG